MTHQSTPLISIVVVVYNGAKTLQQCIDSISHQTYPNKELIIIDGDSLDGTVELLKLNQENIAYWISEPDRGIGDAWNKGLKLCSGSIIGILNSDDYYAKETLKNVLPYLMCLRHEFPTDFVSINYDDRLEYKV